MSLKKGSPLLKYFDNIVELGMAECKICKQRLRNNRSFNLKQHLRNVHKQNYELWKYFDNYMTEGMAVCKLCNKRIQNRTCNIKIHMRRTHNIEIQSSKTDKEEASCSTSQQPYDEEQIRAVLKKARRSMTNTEKILVKMNKTTLIRSVLGFVVEDRVSLSTLSSQHMQSILQPYCVAISAQESKEIILNVEEIERLLGLTANLMRSDFSNDLHWRLLSLAIENDLNASPNTFCLSVIFIDKNQIQRRNLGIIDLENDEQLSASHIQNILHKFNIDSNQIISAYWDNTKGSYHKTVSNKEYLSEIQYFEEYPHLQLGEVKVERFVGTLAHQCVLDVLKNPNIFKQFLECRNLVKFLSDHTNGYYEQFEKNNLIMPQLDSPWKWGSTHVMIQNLYDARSILENIKYEQSDNPEDFFNMNTDMWLFIEAFRKSFNIVHKSILKFYGEELNFGDFYAQWLKCKLITKKLLSAETKTDSYLYVILTNLDASIERRSLQMLSHDAYMACLYLDPRFQRSLTLSQKSAGSEYLKKLWSLAGLYNFDFVGRESENLEDIPNNEPMDEDEDACLNEYLSQDVNIKDTKTADVYRLIEGLKLSFQTAETNILLFWKAQRQTEPEMHALSAMCFAIPATQNYCKSFYSEFYNLEREENFNNFTKENLLYIRLNSGHLTEAVERLDYYKDENLNEQFPGVFESEDENSNTASTSSVTEICKMAIVHPTMSDLTDADQTAKAGILKD